MKVFLHGIFRLMFSDAGIIVMFPLTLHGMRGRHRESMVTCCSGASSSILGIYFIELYLQSRTSLFLYNDKSEINILIIHCK